MGVSPTVRLLALLLYRSEIVLVRCFQCTSRRERGDFASLQCTGGSEQLGERQVFVVVTMRAALSQHVQSHQEETCHKGGRTGSHTAPAWTADREGEDTNCQHVSSISSHFSVQQFSLVKLRDVTQAPRVATTEPFIYLDKPANNKSSELMKNNCCHPH